VMPCLFDQTTALTEALAGYYENASEGDLIKARNRFATFTEDKRWEGNLTALRPGEGYLFRRMGKGIVEIPFVRQMTSNNSKRRQTMSNGEAGLFTNPKAATNMTMIARVVESQKSKVESIKVYVGDELAAIAAPIDSLYFITIQCDRVGELRFEMNGETLMPEIGTINYSADSHAGSLKAPIILKPTGDKPYKIIENNHVIIIRNNEKYDVTGKKL